MARFYLSILMPGIIMFSSQLAADPDPDYYNSADTTSAQTLRATLHDIIDDHSRIPYTSSETDTWDVLKIGDEDQQNPNNIITIYQNASYPKQPGGNNFYNREHTWPKSYGFPDDFPGNYPYTDMHHLFLADVDYNAARENRPYDNCDLGCNQEPTDQNNDRGGEAALISPPVYPMDSNWTDGAFTDGRWTTWTGRRGEVARALLYMDLRYAGGTHGVTGYAEPNLVLTDDRNLMDQSNTGNNESVAYMGLLSVLLQWHKEDPVDLIEFQHHEAVALYQRNRNPFIDHPEWVQCVFEAICNQFSINAGLNDAWYNPDTNGQGFFITVFPELGVVSLAWFTYDTSLPSAGDTANLGDPGHRWITALGSIKGKQVLMNIDVASGGIFDTQTDIAHQPDGTIILTFKDCNSATVEYNIPSINRQGVVPIKRVAEDNVALCKTLSGQ